MNLLKESCQKVNIIKQKQIDKLELQKFFNEQGKGNYKVDDIYDIHDQIAYVIYIAFLDIWFDGEEIFKDNPSQVLNSAEEEEK